MRSQRERMLSGEPYRADDPELVAGRRACQRLLEVFNASPAGDERSQHVLHQLFGSLGEGSVILPRLQCDYGAQIAVGAGCFINYDAILLDCASITIGDNVSIGPRAQLVTALHPCRVSNSLSYSHLPRHVDGIYDTKMRQRSAVLTGV